MTTAIIEIKTVISPFVVIVDSREQSPYTFESIYADARQRRRPVQVQKWVGGLATGDYSISGMESVVAIERKSLKDLFSTIGQSRARFVRELERLAKIPHAFVIVEAEWSEIFANPPEYSLLKPKTVFRSVLAWQARYPNIHWCFYPGREFAEKATYRILERTWKEKNGGGK